MRKILAVLATVAMTFSAMAAMFDTVDVEAIVGEGSGSFITIEPATLSFGTVNPSPATHRFSSTMLTCEWYAANGPWSVEVSANNPTNLSGLVAERAGEYYSIPLKFWTANYGGAGDPNDNDEWTGTNAVFRWVLDNEESYLFKLGTSAEESASPTPFKFAIDAEGALKTNY
ncbi:MAG: hypothetical protein JXB04_10400, partial [Kiritimatiellae bacterium]|nr:hypothetical protein [Kiritimatiellia bacterium]